MVCNFIGLAVNVDKLKNGFGGEGNWMCLKCFYENHTPDCQGDCEGCQYGEFYVNINPKIGVLELNCKDPDYAEDLIEAFRRAMSGK